MDFPYLILYIILLILSINEWRKPSYSGKYYKIASWVVFIFIAFRAPVVGADTWGYYRYAIGIRNFYNYDQRELEPLYLIYNSFWRNYCPLGLLWMIVNTLIIFSPIWYILKKYVKYKTLGVFLFFAVFHFSPFFVALRQILSLSIILWGVVYVMEDKKYKWLFFLGLCSIAYFMHTTAVVVGFFYIVAYFFPLKSKLLPFAVIVGSSIVGIILIKIDVLQIFQLLLAADISVFERVKCYFEDEELKDNINITVTLRNSVMSIIAFYLMDKEKVNHWFSKIYLIGVVLFNLFCSVPMIHRMIMANTLFVIVVFPWILEGKIYFKKKSRQLINIMLVLLVLYYSRSWILTNSNYDIKSNERMHPYYFFFQDYSSHPSIRYF